MQTVGGFVFHGNAERIAFNVMRNQWTEENDRPGCGSDNYENRYRSKADDYFSSQGETGLNDECRMTKAESMSNDEARRVSFRHFFCHSQLRKQKCVNVGQLLNSFIQRGANAVAGTGARPQ
jgi:hypothetical protein